MAISSVGSNARPGVCTSTTRPTTPFEGQLIYETDTDKVLVWNGSAWLPPSNLPWGTQVFDSSTASQNFDNDTAKTVTSVTLTVYPSRRYRIFGRLAFQPTGANDTNNALYVTCTGFTTRTLWYQTAAVGQNLIQNAQGEVYATASDFGVTSGTGTNKTVNLVFYCGTNGNININPDNIVGANSFPIQFVIDDVGPA